MNHTLLAHLAFFAGLTGYLAAQVIYFGRLMGKWRKPTASKVAAWLLAVGGGFHLGYISEASLVARVCPVESIHFALSVASLVTIYSFLLARRRWKLDALGAFVTPIAIAALLGTAFVGLSSLTRRLPPVFLAAHVAANLVGDALFLLASVSAALYLFSEKRLKEKRGGSIFGKLPPLAALDNSQHRFLLGGFPLLTLGIISGSVWAAKLETGHWATLLRAAFAGVTWLIFASVLLLRVVAGWRGRKAALGTLIGFIFALIVLVIYLIRPAVGAAV